jgi:hypothetical protein
MGFQGVYILRAGNVTKSSLTLSAKLLNRLAEAVKLLTCVREVTDSNILRDSGWILRGSPQSLQENIWVIPSIRLRQLLSLFFPIPC